MLRHRCERHGRRRKRPIVHAGNCHAPGGAYIFAFTGNATTGKIAYSGTAPLALSSAASSSTSSSGAMTFPIAIPSAGVTYSGYGTPAIILH